MKIKLVLILSIVVFVFAFSSVAYAQTMTDAQRQALILQLQQEITLLIQQIQQAIAQQQGNSAWCYTFNNNIGYANSGTADVINLHIALQKRGISYSPDDIGTYSTGTSNGVIQFQTNYGISPRSGYVGPITRAELNLLYGCTTTKVTCVPKWQCTDWTLCLNGQQSKVCTDSNNCGINTGKPTESQACTEKPAVKIQANNSDGPVNIFLTRGAGANIISSGLNLSQNINLQWTGVDVSSCRASDSLTPTIFSGYVPNSSFKTVTLSGNIPGTISSSSKISDTFKISCISTSSGTSVSDSVAVNLFYTVSGNCTPNWQCTSWGVCSSSKQVRACTDYNGCGSLVGKPIVSQSCVVPPTVNIKANNSDGPVAISSGGTVTLSWTSTGATSCTASGGWSGNKVVRGTELTTAITTPETFTITCTNAGGEAHDSVTVNVTGGT